MQKSGLLLSSVNAAIALVLKKASLKDVLMLRKTKAPVSVQKDSSVLSIVDSIRSSREGAVLVMDGRFAIGIFTERDLLDLLLRGVNLKQCMVGKEMSECVVSGTPETTLGEALNIMQSNNIRHLPVAVFLGPAIDDDTRVSQILSTDDILHFLSNASQNKS